MLLLLAEEKEQYMITKAVIFDFGRVLGNFDPHKPFERLAKEAISAELDATAIEDEFTSSGLRERVECGLSGEEDLLNFFGSLLSLSISAEVFREIWGNIITPNVGVEDIVAKISPDVKKLVLSNTEPIHWRYIEQLPIMQIHFADPHLLVRSYMVGARKPDEKIFLEGVRRVELPPEQILYVDDVPQYVEVFRSLGGKGLHYDCSRNSLSVLEESLALHGLLE